MFCYYLLAFQSNDFEVANLVLNVNTLVKAKNKLHARLEIANVNTISKSKKTCMQSFS